MARQTPSTTTGGDNVTFAPMMEGLASEDAVPKTVLIDATYWKAHRAASRVLSKKGGARRPEWLPDRQKEGDKIIKRHAVIDAKGRPIRFYITSGNVTNYAGAASLLFDLPKAEWLLANRDSDADWFRDTLKDKALHPEPEVMRQANRDKSRYKRRNRIEIMFERLKEWRRVATRYNRTPKVFLSAVALAAIVMLLPLNNHKTSP